MARKVIFEMCDLPGAPGAYHVTFVLENGDMRTGFLRYISTLHNNRWLLSYYDVDFDLCSTFYSSVTSVLTEYQKCSFLKI